MSKSLGLRTVLGIVGGFVLFYGCATLTRFLVTGHELPKINLSQIVLKMMMIVVSLVLWGVLRRPWSEMGWKRSIPGVRKLEWYCLAAVAMGISTMIMVLTDSRHPVAANMSFLELFFAIWILSSVSEEIFVRGLLQSWIAGGPDATESSRRSRLVIASSATVFAAMHVPLIWMGAGVIGGLAVVFATFVVGWSAAELRARTDSLYHAILVHIFGNMASVPFGILSVIIYRILHGHLPKM